MNKRLVVLGLSGLALGLTSSGCALWASENAARVSEPVAKVRQPRLLQVPEDLRLPSKMQPNELAPMQSSSTVAVRKEGGDLSSLSAASTNLTNAVAAPTSSQSEQKLFFAPYLPSSKESVQPKVWNENPVYDFPWITGAQPDRINEETVVGEGERMLGRLFAAVDFGSIRVPLPESAAIQDAPASRAAIKNKNTLKKDNSSSFLTSKAGNAIEKQPAIQSTRNNMVPSNCAGVTCLDLARNILVEDASKKNWKVLLNRRVSMHQSFQFRRDDRIVSIEITSDGGSKLKMEYAITPNQAAKVQATQNALLPASGFAGSKPLSIGLNGAGSKVSAISTLDWTIGLADTTLKALLTRWSERARWKLVWESDLDLPLSSSSGTIKADFPAAVKIAMDTLVIESDRLIVDIFESDKVIRVERRY